MEISQCKKCNNYLSFKEDKVVCSYKNSIRLLDINSLNNNKITVNCPLINESNNKFNPKKINCQICENMVKNKKGCPLCNQTGYLHETITNKDSLVIPHLCEFRIKAVKIGNKYKIIMLTENNQKLVAQSAEYDFNDNSFNKIYNLCKNKIN